ncbi:MAG: toll/interleukin-1 receptor domain-containing protein [Rhodoluna sp.]
MKVFISWSGEASQQVANLLKDFLACTLGAAKTFLSSTDISKGSRWSIVLAKELQDTDFGIILLSQDNLSSPWILFESGALSKSIDSGRVCPVLLGALNATDLTGPLSEFQATNFNKEDICKLVASINSGMSESKLDTRTFHRVFDKWWPELERDVEKAMTGQSLIPVIRSNTEILQEVLELTRYIARSPYALTDLPGNSIKDPLIPIDGDGAIIAPSGEEWNHPVSVSIKPLPLPKKSGLGEIIVDHNGTHWSEIQDELNLRGVVITLYFRAEAGQFWGVRLGFHKGITYGNRFLLTTQMAEMLKLPTQTIWRD